MKNKPRCVLEEIERRWGKLNMTFSDLMSQVIKACWPDQTAYLDDSWYETDIPLDKCYFAHTDFRGYPVPKDETFIGFLKERISEIESHSFPMAREIRATWEHEPTPPPMVEERHSNDPTRRVIGSSSGQNNIGGERYYVLDGQLRVVRHWYHKKTTVHVYIYRGTCNV